MQHCRLSLGRPFQDMASSGAQKGDGLRLTKLEETLLGDCDRLPWEAALIAVVNEMVIGLINSMNNEAAFKGPSPVVLLYSWNEGREEVSE